MIASLATYTLSSFPKNRRYQMTDILRHPDRWDTFAGARLTFAQSTDLITDMAALAPVVPSLRQQFRAMLHDAQEAITLIPMDRVSTAELAACLTGHLALDDVLHG